MPVTICPRCKQPNPDYAIYCHFDGVVLQANQQQATLKLPNEFKFPSGRRCRTFDELAQGCQEEWSAARDLLLKGAFAQFFRSCSRADLERAANDARAQTNPDIGLTTFLSSLPGTRTATPKLDLNPRRILLGNVAVGDVKTVPLTINNQGQGMLQGTVTVSEGQDWLSLSESKPLHEIEVNAAREQVAKLTINTRGVAAGQTYGARLTVVTNGGVVEVPLRMDLVAQPFAKAPFQGVRTQRELAEKMRTAPKAAVPILESGDVQRWFALNGWNYPVTGTPIKGVASVQQFFEGMGVSKPPAVNLSKSEVRFTCKYKDSAKGQVTLQTPAKKWVYAQVTSDSPWLKVTNPSVAGPQHATVAFEIDTNLWNLGTQGEGKLSLVANGGQKLTLKLNVEVPGAPAIQKPRAPLPAPPPPPMPAPPPLPLPTATSAPPPVPSPVAAGMPPYRPAPPPTPEPAAAVPARSLKYVQAFATVLLACVVLRLLLIPIADLMGRASAASSAAEKLEVVPDADSDFARIGGWLKLPWLPILAGANAEFSAEVFKPGSETKISTLEFRHYYAGYFLRWLMLRTWWIGAIVGAIWVLRRGGGPLDVPFAVVAGAVGGIIASITLGAIFLVGEIVPHAIYHVTVGAQGGFGYLLLWSVFALVSWFLIGLGLAFVLPVIGPLRRAFIDPLQELVASILSLFGMKALSVYWSPNES